MIIEVKPREGGEDAAAFADDLVSALLKWSNVNTVKTTMLNAHTMKVEGRKECL